MSKNTKSKRPFIARLALAVGAGLACFGLAGVAQAGAPLPYDFPTPPPNITVAQFYNQYLSASSYYSTNGVESGNTHVAIDVPILRIIHTFSPIDGMLPGVQVIEPYISYLGNVEVGGASLSRNNGFAEPLLSGFLKVYNDPADDQVVTLAYFFSPPTGAYNPNYVLNAGTNNYVNNFEVLYSHIVAGTPKTPHLDFDIALDSYIYSNNNNFTSGFFKGAEHTQPTEQILAYLPYYFHPQTGAYVGLSFEQTFGGKQYLTGNVTLPNGFSFPYKKDTGTRSDVTQVGIVAGSFVSPTVALQTELTTDVRVRGGVKNDVVFLVQVAKVF
ncbi:MAG: transporter [Acidiphilium sp.]